jgi:hypothetical protein
MTQMVPQLPDRCSKNRGNSQGSPFGRTPIRASVVSLVPSLQPGVFFQGFPALPFDFMPNRK